MSQSKRPHVVVVGGGFGGLQVARSLKGAPCRITLVDRSNHHLFQPLLYQVATGGLSEANIAAPLRRILRKHGNCETIMAEVQDFAPNEQKVLLADGELTYDYLILAAGAESTYFGNDHFAKYAPGLKSLEDARDVRTKTFVAFEAAERESDAEARKAWLTFVVVGGGPTGVELAGAISEISRQALVRDFRNINPADARIILVEAGPRVLGPFTEATSDNATKALESMGVEVLTGTTVVGVEQDHADLKRGDEEFSIPCWTVIWGAGVQANPLGAKLAKAAGLEPARGGRLPVTARLTVEGLDNVYALGDITSCKDKHGRLVPGLGAAAKQQGEFLAKQLKKALNGNPSQEEFAYADKGSMATIGRRSAVAEFGKKRYKGVFAWAMWMFVHLMLLVQFQNRVLVFIQWTWNYFTFSRSSRLILGLSKVAIPGHERQPGDGDGPSAECESKAE